LAEVHVAFGRPDEARQCYAHSREAFHAAGHHYQVGRSATDEVQFLLLPYQADAPPERRQMAREAEGAWQRASGALAGLPPRLAHLHLLLLEGQWAEAHQLAQAGYAVGYRYRSRFASPLAALAREQGDAALAWTVVQEVLPEGPATAPGNSFFLYIVPLLRLAAALATDARNLALARAWLEAHDRWLDWNGTVLGRAEGQLGWAEYHRTAGDHALARQHAGRALAHATEPRQPLALLATHRLLGVLDVAAGHYAEAGTRLDEALALADACAAPYERALTLLALTELHAATGKSAEARALLEEARAICTSLEARPALARADALAARLDAPEPAPATAPTRGYPAGLTAREVEVMRLVAAGLTDAQVAERLSLSPRTVTTHLTSVYNKLGVSTRLAAARFAIDHQLA
jgi:DNA-binding NarL/FixJ family response regulator